MRVARDRADRPRRIAPPESPYVVQPPVGQPAARRPCGARGHQDRSTLPRSPAHARRLGSSTQPAKSTRPEPFSRRTKRNARSKRTMSGGGGTAASKSAARISVDGDVGHVPGGGADFSRRTPQTLGVTCGGSRASRSSSAPRSSFASRVRWNRCWRSAGQSSATSAPRGTTLVLCLLARVRRNVPSATSPLREVRLHREPL
jgi:hypothetical protein